MPPALLKHSSVLSRFRHIATSQTDGGARSACGVHVLDGTTVEGRKQGRSSWALRSTAGGLLGSRVLGDAPGAHRDHGWPTVLRALICIRSSHWLLTSTLASIIDGGCTSAAIARGS